MLVSDVRLEIGRSRTNAFKRKGKTIVGRTAKVQNLKKAVSTVVDSIGGFSKTVSGGDRIFLKPNFNTADAPPGSCDPDFVKAIIELFYEHGARKVILGESSMLRTSTRNVLRETGMLDKAEEAGAEIICFDEGEWKEVVTGGRYLKTVSLPETALGAEKLVYACCMKTHRWAKLSLSLKLAVGFMKPDERIRLHMRNLEEKIADLNLIIHPDLVIMDGRRCFISGGPAKGELRMPNVLLASGDRVALDVEAIKTIESFDGASLKDNPWTYTQIKRAVKLGLGVQSEQEYEVVEE